MTTERRASARQRSFIGGRIAYNDRASTMDCLVRNVFTQGAKIAFSGAVLLPQEFDLSVPHKGLEVRARVVWRAEDELGVAFLSPAPRPAASGLIPLDLARRLRDAEAQNAALKRRVTELSSAE